MNTNKKTTRILEDVKVNVKIKLSALWVALTLIYIYADLLPLFKPEILASEGVQFTRFLLFFAVIIMTIPSVMVFLSLALKPKVNRWANIILGIVYTGVNIANVVSFKEIWAFIIFINIVEIVLTLLIVWYAWKWPKQEG